MKCLFDTIRKVASTEATTPAPKAPAHKAPAQRASPTMPAASPPKLRLIAAHGLTRSAAHWRLASRGPVSLSASRLSARPAPSFQRHPTSADDSFILGQRAKPLDLSFGALKRCVSCGLMTGATYCEGCDPELPRPNKRHEWLYDEDRRWFAALQWSRRRIQINPPDVSPEEIIAIGRARAKKYAEDGDGSHWGWKGGCND